MDGEAGEEFFAEPVAGADGFDGRPMRAGARKAVHGGFVWPDREGDLIQQGQFADPGFEDHVGVAADVGGNVGDLFPELHNGGFPDGSAGEGGDGSGCGGILRIKRCFAAPRPACGLRGQEDGPVFHGFIPVPLKDFRLRGLPLCCFDTVPRRQDRDGEWVDGWVEPFAFACAAEFVKADPGDPSQRQACGPHHH